MTAALYRLGRFCANHPGRVILVWLLAVAVIGAFALLIGQQTSNQLTLPGTDSQRASNLLQNNFPDEANGSVPVAFRAPKGEKLTDSRYKKPIENVTKAYSNHPGVAKVTGPFDQEGSDQLNKQETIGYISLNLKDGQGQLDDGTARSIIAVDRPLEKAGLDPAAGGYLGQEVSRPSTHPSEITGLIAAMIILLFTFGTVVAMGLPIVTAILGLGAGLGIVTLLSNVLTVPTAAPALATMIGLGVGIDYALFIVTRYRDQLAEGLEAKESAARATATGGGAVVFAGSTVIIALVALSASGTALVAMLGYMAAVVVLAAVLGGITLLPAILGLLGRRVNSLPLPAMRRRRSDDGRLHGWTRWATFVGSRPWTAVIVGVVLLVILATPVLSLRLGQPDNGEMPRSTQLGQAYDLMTEGFGAGSNGPMLIAVDLSKPATNNQKELNELKQQQQQAIQQNTSEQQAKAENEIQQQADQKKQQANQEIQQQADQNKQQAAQEIQEQADQQAQGLSQEAQEEIDQQAQQQIAAENQQIQQQADQKKQQEAQSIQQQANQTKAEENQKIEQQVRQRVEQQTAQKEKFLESKASDPRLMDLRSDLQKTKGVDSVSFPLVDNQGNAAVYTLISKTAPSSAATTDLVDRLRDNVIPKDTRGEQMDAYVGGITAGYIDLASEITAKLPLVIAIVLVLSFLLLLLAFQSLVVSIKAVTMNVLSVLAAFGVLTYVFSHEWTANLIGLDNPIPIVSYVPLMMFAVLFGLSMDYEVFLMTEVRERWKATGDAHQAAVQGLAGTGRVIASAALIMVSVFLAFVLNGDPTIKQFGLGMAVAVAIDAPIVRCTLVPAIMTLLGRAGWWMPKWMKRVTPQLSIEGEQWFAERDAQGAGNAEPEKRPRVR